MRRDHRPYFIKKIHLNIQKLYARHFLLPQFEYLGPGFSFLQPWHVEVFGKPVRVGKYANFIATSDHKVRLSIWSESKGQGSIDIGDYCLICPGVRIGSAHKIQIGDNCMIASGTYITDSDWHDIYNRIVSGSTAPVILEDNVWLGDSCIICKGVSIGKNSIVGAGSVVVNDIPDNVIAAGNPAKVVKTLDPNEKIVTRQSYFADPAKLSEEVDELDKDNLHGNTLRHWLRTILCPRERD